VLALDGSARRDALLVEQHSILGCTSSSACLRLHGAHVVLKISDVVVAMVVAAVAAPAVARMVCVRFP